MKGSFMSPKVSEQIHETANNSYRYIGLDANREYNE
jgi:hypothetical protein